MSIRKNIISNFILTASNFLFPLITFPFITRTLSEESLGSVLFIDAFTQYFIIFSSFGIPLYGMREVSKLKNSPSERSKLVLELIIIKLVLSIIFSIIFLAMYLFIPSLNNNLDLIKLGCISIISSSFLLEWFYQGIEHFSFITKRTIMIKSLSVVLILILVKSYDDKLIYYLILVGLNTFNALVNFGFYLTKFHKKVKTELDLIKHVKPLFILFSINIAISIYTVLDTIILGIIKTSQDVSYYVVSLKLSKLVTSIVLAIGFVLIPQISKLYFEKRIFELRLLISKSIDITLLITIPFCFFSIMFSQEILSIITGEKYLVSNQSFMIASLLPLIIGLCNIVGTQFLLPIGKEKKILHGTVLGLIISILLNLFLIPIYGFLGATLTILLTEFSVCLYLIIIVNKKIRLYVNFKTILHIIISLTVVYLFISAFHHTISPLKLMIVALIFYIVIFLLLQFIYFKNEVVSSILKLKISNV